MPPISLGKGPVPIFPPDRQVKNFFDKIGTTIEIKSEKLSQNFWAISGSMTSFYELLKVLSDWLVKKKLRRNQAQKYITSLYSALAGLAAAHSENSLSAFVRNHETGSLKYIGYVKNGIGRVKGIEGINSVDISPDGKQVYVTAQESRSLVTFNRQKNGVITFQNQLTESDFGNSGLIIKAPLIRKPGIYGLNWYPNTESLENTEYKVPSVGGAKLSFNLMLLSILSGTTLIAFSALIIYRMNRYNIQNK